MTDAMQIRTADERRDRLREGADSLRGARGRLNLLDRPNLLMGVSSVMMTLGLSIILLGWLGASRQTRVTEQVPYLISGGLFGLALAVIGALLLFTHWLTIGIRESRARDRRQEEQHAQLLAALEAARFGGEVHGADSGSDRNQRPLRATPRG